MEGSRLSVWAIVAIIILKQVGAESDLLCATDTFKCLNGECLPRTFFCNGVHDCSNSFDKTDEDYCDIPEASSRICLSNWFSCADKRSCLPSNFRCDGKYDCFDGSDEGDACFVIHDRHAYVGVKAMKEIEKNKNVIRARIKLVESFLRKHKNDTSTNKWGSQLHRIATALHLANETFFSSGNIIGEEMKYELTIRLLYKMSANDTLPTQELALYIHALIVTCADPRNFFGRDLVSQLRGKVESANYTNPFAILVLCNTGDNMTDKDVKKVTAAFDSRYRPFWTDTQAISIMALQCISIRSKVNVDERILKDMQEDIKKQQFSNGTVDNPITTALVIQALLSKDSYKQYFDLNATIDVLLQNQESDGSWGSVRNSYYVLLVLFHKSLLNITNQHCKMSPETDEEALLKLQETKGKKSDIQYSIWIGNDVDFVRTWRVKMTERSTFYDVIEIIRKLDSKHNVKYNVIDNKPYVSALYGKEDDSELGMYWFTYVKSMLTPGTLTLLEASPVDLKVNPNQELILWYKSGTWIGNPTISKTDNLDF